MARQKQATPLRREHSSEYIVGTPTKMRQAFIDDEVEEKLTMETNGHTNGETNGSAIAPVPVTLHPVAVGPQKKQAGLFELVVGVAGIYGSFLTWAFLQERLTTTPYGRLDGNTEVFKFPVFLNTIQSLFAVLTGLSYLFLSTPKGAKVPSIFPSKAVLLPLIAVAVTSSLASPFGYASLAHIDYITFILAKSCKLLPVMFLHITLFGKRYPWHKYAVVLSVTAGVAVFTLHATSAKKHASKTSTIEKNRLWGLLMLAINLLLDGLTNTTQDYIFTTFRPFSGPQMMCATNILSTLLTTSYLTLSPFLASTPIGTYLGLDLSSASTSGGEFSAALSFLARHPAAWIDALGFSACGAIGQLFIFYTLSNFDSVLLVTVTVTRKMITMVLSVVAFGHHLSIGQWAGVGLVFVGVGGEGWMARREKKLKAAAQKTGSAPAGEGKKEL